MNITIDGIKNHFQSAYQFAVEQGGKLAGHAVTYLKPVLELIRQDARVAGVTVAVANILMLHIAICVINQADKMLVRSDGSEKEDWFFTHSILSIISVASLVVGCNIALYQRVKSPLSPMVTALISTAALASYMLFCAWRASGKGAE